MKNNKQTKKIRKLQVKKYSKKHYIKQRGGVLENNIILPFGKTSKRVEKTFLGSIYNLLTKNRYKSIKNSEVNNTNSQPELIIAVPEIYELLFGTITKNNAQTPDFIKDKYLPTMNAMKKAGVPTYFTENKVHPEFPNIQKAKKGQYYTAEYQVNIKSEPFIINRSINYMNGMIVLRKK